MRVEPEIQRGPDGRRVRSVFVLTLTSKLVPGKGSPRQDGSFWTTSGYPPDEAVTAGHETAVLVVKSGALSALLGQDGQWLEATGPDGLTPLRCRPRLRSLQFADGPWVQFCDYVATFEADSIYLGGAEVFPSSGDDPVEEAWEVEQTDESARAYRLTHTVSCQRPVSYSPSQSGYERAKALVQARLGFSSAALTQSGTLSLSPSFTGYDHARAVNEDRAGGAYRVTESWVCFDSPAIEDYSATARQANGRTTVTVDGTIRGLLTRNSDFSVSSPKASGAYTKWQSVYPTLLTRAQAAAGLTLNPVAISEQVVTNEAAGTIGYAYEFDNRSLFGATGVAGVSVSLRDSGPAAVFASIPVVGRLTGPVLQDIGSSTQRSRTITVEAQATPAMYPTTLPARPDVSAVVLAYAPAGTVQIFKERDDEDWDVSSGRYARSVTYVYEV